ncbi:MAG: 4-(cytidine 5'-diphospho)-2-C-methyl-D-erythritol kinase [Candidatus Pelagibacterales bacterium]|nr:MAG: 4-(cytidine 5'-diphospho)-2-C-methyl-D-erythritol kinase [Pelagibacterales bacterium]
MRATVHNLKSYAKINLSLNVIGKRKPNKLHSIETFVSLINLADEIKINEVDSKNHKVIFIGKFSKGIPKVNTITKLLKLMDKKKLLQKKYEFLIKKNIPQQSGMGGGSMNAATILSFFKSEKILTKKQTENFAQKIGSDVILGLNRLSKIYYSDGKVYEIKKSLKYYLVLVKPNFGCSTRKIFSLNKVFSKKQFSKSKKNISKNIIFNSKNDLENSAFKAHPKLKQLKNQLINWKKAEFVRMTGSGSTLVMYFNSNETAKNALKTFKRRLNNSWCILSKVI